jgi:putative ABC transport system permease protein
MLRNFFLIATRNFVREHVYGVINLSGLIMGLTCSIFIFLWVLDEVRFDRFHKNYERIYQVMENQTYSNGEILTYHETPAPLAEKLRSELAEIEQSSVCSWPQKTLFSVGPFSIYQHGYYADDSFLKLFTFPLIEGNPDHLLSENNSIVISRTMAATFFPGESALGKILRADNEMDLKITGVIEDTPENSTLRFDYILPFSLYAQRTHRELNWAHHSSLTYVKLRQNADAGKLESKIKGLLHALHAESAGIDLHLLPLTDWRLFSEFENGKQTGGGRIGYVITFSSAAFLILLAACINFMNLATARAARRAKEVGIRKVAGATFKTLVQQFLTESILLSFVALALSMFIVHLMMPLFNMLSGKNLDINYSDFWLIGSLVAITFFTGLAAGSYPAFFLSSFKPSSVLKGNLFSATKGISLRKSLVLFQFALSVIVILCALVINDQIQFMLTKDLGYDKEHMVHFQPRPGSLKNIQQFKNHLLQNPSIESVGQAHDHPMNIYNNDNAWWEGLAHDESVTVQTTVCDPDYFKTLRLELLKGRFFSADIASDSTGFVINETCAQLMGFDDPVGKRFRVYTSEGTVIGVVKDFHHRHFSGAIDPVIFVIGQPDANPMEVFIRFKAGEAARAVEHIQEAYAKFEPAFPLELSFLDQDLELMYRRDILMGQLSFCFMVIMVFISCLGLFGLTLYTTERRTKEIGVRKVLGASSLNVVLMLCKDFAKPIVLSVIIGFPFAWFLMDKFLSQYQFHTELSGLTFVITGVSVLAIAAITVGYSSVKAAHTNPAETLRTE